ncbi:oxidoreductase-like domain-containing protein [Noviherbaspirillum aerium]|uniref:oxidoreductase-like domain-containing protein n=1 Tax=Noviherbaspirillum aerium TaxID=2588497 RepID=UPI00124DAA67
MNSDQHNALPSNAEQARQWIGDLREQLAQRGLVFRDPPEAPTTCCGRGCNGCVWEAYFHAVGYWCGQVRQIITAMPQVP